MRRKTLVNNLSQSYNLTKEKIKEILNTNQIDQTARSEDLDYQTLRNLYKNVKNALK